MKATVILAGVTACTFEAWATVLASNGFVNLGGVGTTAQRPPSPRAGQRYIDLSINADIVCDSRGNWRNVATGGIV